MAVALNLRASIPVKILKSLLSKEIRLLSPGFIELAFFGLLPNTIKEDLMDMVGWAFFLDVFLALPLLEQHPWSPNTYCTIVRVYRQSLELLVN